jgi:peptidoglycan/LPS O-acetylase OafA/YrhL
MQPKSSPKLYFPGLNGLRFIAAFAVFFGHTNLFIKFVGAKAIDAYIMAQLGNAGVGLFFVISGYLITYLLLVEKETYQKIALGNFYARRILRIWPLYYWVMFIALLIIPLCFYDPAFSLRGVSDFRSFILFALFLPFLSMCIFPSNILANILWSVGVEEMYYLFWPLIIQSAKKLTLSLFLAMLIVFLALKAVFTYLPYKVHAAHDFFQIISNCFVSVRFDHMLIGGMMAYIVLHKPDLMKVFKNRIAFFLSFLLILYYLFIGFNSFYFGLNPIIRYMIDPIIFASLCAVIVVNITHDLGLSDPMEGQFFFFMGQISYGFYVYHSIVLFLLIRVLVYGLGMDRQGITFALILYGAGFVLTTLISYISYHYFESKFLAFKKRFTTIISGNDAR